MCTWLHIENEFEPLVSYRKSHSGPNQFNTQCSIYKLSYQMSSIIQMKQKKKKRTGLNCVCDGVKVQRNSLVLYSVHTIRYLDETLTYTLMYVTLYAYLLLLIIIKTLGIEFVCVCVCAENFLSKSDITIYLRYITHSHMSFSFETCVYCVRFVMCKCLAPSVHHSMMVRRRWRQQQ